MDKADEINQYYPDFAIDTIQFLGSGYDSEAYVVNEEYVFKFPRHEIAAKNLYKEAKVLLQIHDQLPIKVPEIKFVGPSDQPGQMLFVGYEKIGGEELTPDIIQTLDEETLDSLAKEVAGFFTVLHAIELDSELDELVIDKREKCAKEYEVIKSIVLPVVPEETKNQINALYEALLTTEFSYKSCLVHNDFGASNIFFDPLTNKITGIIDFGDIAIYDRDIDFICLLQSQEEGFDQAFVDNVFAHYGSIDLETVAKKNTFNEFYGQFENVYLGYAYGMDELFKESLESLKQGISGYQSVMTEQNYVYYI